MNLHVCALCCFVVAQLSDTLVGLVQVDSVPSYPQLVTSQVPLLGRWSAGSANCVYLGDNNNSYIPAYGFISEWQFHVKQSGRAAFQVWRRRDDLGVQK